MNIESTKEDLLSQKRFELLAGEKPIIEGLSSYLKSSLNVISCRAALTSQRIVVCKKNIIGGMMLFGIAGAAVSLVRKQTKIMFQILLSDIVHVKKMKHGFSKKYRFTTRLNDNYDLQFTHPERWENELKLLDISIE